MGVVLRPATADDLPGMAHSMLEGFDGYRSFAPAGWEPPTHARELERSRARFAQPDAWALVAIGDGGVQAGHVSLLDDVEQPGRSVYLWQLFVRAPHQGTGLAVTLHDAFLDAARARGYSRARLRTPAGQARARRFYEREGWRVDGPPVLEPLLGLELVTYRREGLASSASPAGVRS